MNNVKRLPRPQYMVCLFLVIATLAVYWQVQNHDFVSFDDGSYVTENRHVQKGLTAEGIRWAFTTTYAANWHPLTWISHMLAYEIYGLNPRGHHLTNLLLHLANTLLLFFVLGQMTGALWRSAFVAALFALHPLHVESVAWVAERKDVLSTFWGMLSLLAYQRYVKQPRIFNYILIIFFLSLSLMSKPMLVTLPFVFLLLDFLPLERFQRRTDRLIEDEEKSALASRDIFRLIWEKVPLLVPVVISSILTFRAQSSMGAVKSLEVFSLKVRVANAFVSYVSYVVKAIWPVNLAVFYPHLRDLLPWWQVIGSAMLVAAACFWAIRVSKRYPYVLVGMFWYFGTLVPVIGLVQAGSQAMADRYMYVPLIGLFILITWGVSDLLTPWRYKQLGLAIAAGVVISALMICTWFQLRHWKNSITLYRHALHVTPNNGIAHFGLGNVLDHQGKLDQAIIHYSKSLQIYPNYVRAHNSLGAAFARKGNVQKAIYHYNQALRIDPESSGVYANLGKVFMNQGMTAKAIHNYQEALRINPDIIMALYNLSWIFATHENDKFRDGEKAFKLAQKLCELTGYNQAFALDALAAAHAENGRYDEAVKTARKGLKLALRDGSEELAVGLTKRLEFYQAGHSFRQIRMIINEPKNHE